MKYQGNSTIAYRCEQCEKLYGPNDAEYEKLQGLAERFTYECSCGHVNIVETFCIPPAMRYAMNTFNKSITEDEFVPRVGIASRYAITDKIGKNKMKDITIYESTTGEDLSLDAFLDIANDDWIEGGHNTEATLDDLINALRTLKSKTDKNPPECVEYEMVNINGFINHKIGSKLFNPSEVEIKYYKYDGLIADGSENQKGWLWEAIVHGIPKEDIVEIIQPSLNYSEAHEVFTEVKYMIRK